MQRRTFLHLGFSGWCVACAQRTTREPSSASSGSKPSDPRAELAQLEREIGGRVGVFAFASDSDRTVSHRAEERFAMCSTFKWALAALVLHRSDSGALELSEELPFDATHLQEWAPVTGPLLAQGRMRVDALAEAAVTMSDNTATNLLLARIGGPPAVTRFFRQLDDRSTRLDRIEPELNENAPGDPRDTTTPRAMAQALERALDGPLLTDESKARLMDWLERTETGLDRLRAGFPASLRAGDKTGTGHRGAVGDVAVAWPKSGHRWYVASYLSGSTAPLARLVAAHARIGAITARALASAP